MRKDCDQTYYSWYEMKSRYQALIVEHKRVFRKLGYLDMEEEYFDNFDPDLRRLQQENSRLDEEMAFLKRAIARFGRRW